LLNGALQVQHRIAGRGGRRDVLVRNGIVLSRALPGTIEGAEVVDVLFAKEAPVRVHVVREVEAVDVAWQVEKSARSRVGKKRMRKVNERVNESGNQGALL
jgi:hypothetical protein